MYSLKKHAFNKHQGRFKALWVTAALTLVMAFFVYSQIEAGTPQVNRSAVFTLTHGTIESVITSQGKLEPKASVDVGAQASGQIKKLYFKIGDTVKKGDLIAEIDPQIYQSKVEADQARLNMLNAQINELNAKLTVANLKLNRSKTLLHSDYISHQAYDDTVAASRIAQAQLSATKAQIDEAQYALNGDKANLGYTKIYAPMDGTIVQQNVKEGQTVNAVQSTPIIAQLANLDSMTVRAQVAEADIMQVKPDMGVYFTTLGADGRKWEGHIRQVLPSPETVNDVVLYNVLVDVDNKDRQLMAGMSTQMFFVRGKTENARLLSIAALGKRVPEHDTEIGLAYRVNILKGSAAIEKTIHIGLTDRSNAEVKDGLDDTDQVVLPTEGNPS